MTHKYLLLAAGLSLAISIPASAQTEDSAAARIITSPAFKQATTFIESDQERFVRELIALTEIPAPPFKEEARANAYLDMLRQHGLTDVEMDSAGNVMGVRKGASSGNLLAVVAHLDTVFPEGTNVTVKRQGTRLAAPGIGDDTRGLALMLAIIRAMDAAQLQTANDILFVGNVGEEGEGDLRGVKYLLQKGKYKDRIKQFLAIDGGEQRGLTIGGVGSRRYRVTFKGPGGHSYGAFGLVNPAYALANAMARLSRVQVVAEPKTTFNVGVVKGGTSVNSIPAEVTMDVDLRSESCSELRKLDETFLSLVREAVDEENRVRSTKEGQIVADPEIVGDRPCGETPVDSPMVRSLSTVIKAFGLTPNYSFSSTDSNLPMSLGIPAVTIGRGGPGGRSHSPDEWTDVDPKVNVRNVQVAMAMILAVAGVQ